MNSKSGAFGDLLRAERKRAGRTIGELARQLEVSLPYLSDVELNRRPPMKPDRIRKAAQFLGIAAEPLLKAAAQRVGHFKLTTDVGPKGREVGAALMRGWPQLSEQDFEDLQGWLTKKLGTRE